MNKKITKELEKQLNKKEHLHSICAESVEDAWLEALANTLLFGWDIETEYDNKETPPSKDLTMSIEITKPFSNPIKFGNKVYKVKSKYDNKFKMFGAKQDLFLIESIKVGYIEEIVEGLMDHKIGKGKSYPYTYHDRVFNYKPYSEEDCNYSDKKMFPKNRTPLTIFTSDVEFESVDQILYIVEKLKKSKNSRRAQAITWRPYSDPYRDDPPCLQRIWCRVFDNKLNFQTMWRSRDLFKAWGANVNGMLRIQKLIANELEVEIGSYIDICNSLHIYGQDIKKVVDLFKRMYNRGDYPSYLHSKLEFINSWTEI